MPRQVSPPPNACLRSRLYWLSCIGLSLMVLFPIAAPRAEWRDVTNQLQLTDSRGLAPRQLVEVSITNLGGDLSGALRLVLTNADKEPIGVDGLTGSLDPHPGVPYVLLTSEGLASGESLTRLLGFNPQWGALGLAFAVENGPVPILGDWVDVSEEMRIQKSPEVRDTIDRRLLTRLSVRNLGDQRFGALRLVIPSSSRELLNPDGWTSAEAPHPNAPYIVLSADGLAMGQTIERVLSFAPAPSVWPLRFSTAVENAPIPDSYFIASPLPLSAPDQAAQVGRAHPDITIGSKASGTADESAFAQRTRWFYLVNGSGPTALASASNPPYVLIPNGTPPAGAPNPNGGTGVGVEPLDSNPNGAAIGAAMWKAVPAGTDQFYLRSAQSFEVDSHSIAAAGIPSLLLGYGMTSSQFDQNPGDAPLDLGYVPAFAPQALLSWNQQSSPQGDRSDFQRWSIGDDGSLWNAQAPAPLYSTYTADDSAANSQTAFGTPANAAAAQWYGWPDYALERIYQQPAQPFPAFSGGEQLAYLCLSAQIVESDTSSAPCTNPPTWTGCTLSGDVQSQGMRCQYTSASNDDITTCKNTTENAINGDNAQTSYNGQSFSASDWQTVATQLHQECSFVANVNAQFTTYDQILTDIFLSNTLDLTSIGLDIGLSTDQQVNNMTGLDIAEGLIYSLLSLGDPAAGLVANLMETGITAAEDAGGETASNLTETIKTEVSTLYKDLQTAWNSVLIGLGDAEAAIKTDWGRLQAIQPLLQSTGFNGLAIQDQEIGPVVEAAQDAYALAVMQALVPLAWGLVQSVAVAGSPSDPNTTSSGSFSYETFGSLSGSINTGSLMGIDKAVSPSSAMLADLERYGANPFELYNGLNGWADLPYGIPFGAVDSPLINADCTGSVVTLFSATDQDLTVEVIPSQGEIAAPGVDFSAIDGNYSGSENNLTLELRPYGYLPIFVTANGHDSNDLTVELKITNDGAAVADITFGGDGCRGHDPTAILSQSLSSGWAIDGFNQRAQGSNTPAGLWGTIYQP